MLTMTILAMTTVAQAAYTETTDPSGVTKNLASDYGLVDDDARANQSEDKPTPG